ncbi:MAG: C25 family peptidase propeptide domain-containing protein, partial [candidate division WOR-3 bacterium]
MRKNIILGIALFVFVALATNSEVVNYTNNWGKNPLFNVISETDGGIEVIFSIHQMVIEEQEIDGIPMKTFGIPGIFLPNDEGAPNLAGTGRYIAIPQGAQAKATIVNARTEVYKNVEVAPAPKIPLDNDDSPLQYVKNMDIYSKDAYYPES